MNRNNVAATIAQEPEFANEIFNLLGLHLQLITPPVADDKDFCLFRAAMAPGVFVPIHSHKDHEVFYVLSGQLQGLSDESWHTFGPGDVFNIPGETRHALRNAASQPADFLVLTTINLGRFLHRVARPLSTVPPGPPSPEDLERVLLGAKEMGYWLGNAEGNAAVGLNMYPVG